MFQEAPCTGADSNRNGRSEGITSLAGTDANCAARIKHAKLLLQNFPQSATDFLFFTDEKMFSVASSDNRQNKVAYCRNF